MLLALWLLQATPDTGGESNTTIIRVGAGILALALIVIVFVRRKKKASKEDWT
jgi:LPXTG-motif cell wall-anchored protein